MEEKRIYTVKELLTIKNKPEKLEDLKIYHFEDERSNLRINDVLVFCEDYKLTYHDFLKNPQVIINFYNEFNQIICCLSADESECFVVDNNTISVCRVADH
mgnify:CR=1 FL=1